MTTRAQILIVGSLGGGFGSGALVDVAYIARLAAERGGLKGTPVSAFLLTEEPFDKAGKTSQMRINTMAALREVGRFLLAQNRSFPMRYRYGAHDDLSDRLMSQSLLDDCFIVDGDRGQHDLTQQPPQLGVYPTVADAMQVLIDKPAREGASPLAQFRSNTAQRSDEQVRQNAGAVAGIGCSTYRLPLATLVHECNVRFARSLVELWLAGRNSERARTTDEFGATLALNVAHDVEHKEERSDLPRPKSSREVGTRSHCSGQSAHRAGSMGCESGRATWPPGLTPPVASVTLKTPAGLSARRWHKRSSPC